MQQKFTQILWSLRGTLCIWSGFAIATPKPLSLYDVSMWQRMVAYLCIDNLHQTDSRYVHAIKFLHETWYCLSFVMFAVAYVVFRARSWFLGGPAPSAGLRSPLFALSRGPETVQCRQRWQACPAEAEAPFYRGNSPRCPRPPQPPPPARRSPRPRPPPPAAPLHSISGDRQDHTAQL